MSSTPQPYYYMGFGQNNPVITTVGQNSLQTRQIQPDIFPSGMINVKPVSNLVNLPHK